MEHRWGDRIEVDIPIRIVGETVSSMRIGRLTNISLSGALIQTPYEPRMLSRIQAIWTSSWRPAHSLPGVAACIVRKSLDGIAVEWCEFAPTAVAQIIQAAASYPLPLSEWPPRSVAIRA